MANLAQILEKHFPKIEIPEIFPKIKFPPEVELMDELNKPNRKKYEWWLLRKKYIDKLLGKKSPLDYYAA